ncbi:hypothetical protein JB92DRAFT_3125374 [Gautieria morchelliformis]|nr:hypothetical protein JB92DRAFT_3125374 [Gautieria morchelliformis]
MEWSHFSVLRDESLLKALKPVDYDNRHNLIISDDSVKTITTFMSRVAARTITDVEREVCMFTSVYAHYTPGNTLRILGALGEPQCRLQHRNTLSKLLKALISLHLGQPS